jgi:RNA polymerase sigma-70 factor (ECF subfamily)
MIDLLLGLKSRIGSGGEAILEAPRAGFANPTPEVEAPLDEAAFKSLVDTHYRRTYSLIYRMVRNESDAADLTQETFVRIHRALPRLRETAAQSAWVRRIATNLCLDFLRRRNSAPALSSLDARQSDESDTLLSWDIADPTGEPDRLFSNKERLAVLHRAIESLPADYRMVIIMHHIEELRVEEIAEAMGVPAGTIKSRLSRARRELHRKLSPYFDPDMAMVKR